MERAALLASVVIRKVSADSTYKLRGAELEAAIESDVRAGLIPFYVCATLGTTNICSFDALEEIGPVCKCFILFFPQNCISFFVS